MDSLFELLRGFPIVLPVVVIVLAVILHAAFQKSAVPDSLPWVGKADSGLFAETRASFSSFNNVRQWLAEGYGKYSQQGKSYIFPDFSGKPEIIIPNNKLRWLLDKPDDVSSVGAAHYDQLQGDYAFTSPYILKSLYHEHVVHRNLARNLGALIPGTWDELQHAFDETWGLDIAEWKDVCVFENLMKTITRASNRLFVGLPLCRNEDYLANMGAFAQDIILCMNLMRFIPSSLAPIFGPIFSIPNNIHFNRTTKYTVPLIKQRIEDIEQKREVPNDYITWHVKQAQAEGKIKEMEPDIIARFLMPLNFAAIHTTTFTITMTFFDLLGSDPAKGFLEGLREEAERVFRESNSVWDKTSLSRLVRADSAIRESMRVSNFATRGVLRKIIAKDGLRNEEEGWTAPCGALVGVDVHSMHHDPDVYPEPYTYDAFRFSRPREVYEAKDVEEKDSTETLKMKNTGMISTGDTFLPFGHGRHACPGRFFVNHELKMLLAYVVMNYEVQYLSKRPENQWFGQNVIPPLKDTIKVRRREGTVRK